VTKPRSILRIRLALLARRYKEQVNSTSIRLGNEQASIVDFLGTFALEWFRGSAGIVIHRTHRCGFTTLLTSFIRFIHEQCKIPAQDLLVVVANGRSNMELRENIGPRIRTLFTTSHTFLSDLRTRLFMSGEGLFCFMDVDLTYQLGPDGTVVENDAFAALNKVNITMNTQSAEIDFPLLTIVPHHVKQWLGTHWF
jgi:hypothetical protein